MTAIHIGTSGWSYPEWKGHFYPADLASDDVATISYPDATLVTGLRDAHLLRRSFQQCGGEQHLLPASPAISSGGMD